MDFRYTRQEFLTELLNFRELMGNRSFWAKPEDIRQKAIDGFGFVYLNADLTPDDVTLYMSTMQEYTKRETYMMLYAPTETA